MMGRLGADGRAGGGFVPAAASGADGRETVGGEEASRLRVGTRGRGIFLC